ncbi:uncharacterized protein METZ01_LOCUS231337 [marine metagenome]|uniref:Uncharacterized protein n=1 Tax=marine metagenome TaxID=408172 RepID=A0A382GVA3_9ZZZZ|tara:strand:+ start:835 stop:1050 length:216 start_codon:yes stop_codon:yes gene_type:complete
MTNEFRITADDKQIKYLISKGFKLKCAECGSTWLAEWSHEELSGYECQDCGHDETINHIYTNNHTKRSANL